MPRKLLDKSNLTAYTTDAAAQLMVELIATYGFKLIIKKDRATKLGDYTHPTPQRPYHQITINGSLNKYAFVITFMHEVAHLITWNNYKRKVSPHGEEWKSAYYHLLFPIIGPDYFPEDIQVALRRHCKHIKSSSSYDIQLTEALGKYNENTEPVITIKDIMQGNSFKYKGRVFIKGTALRTRIKCECITNRKSYVFHPLAPVELLEENLV